MWVIRDSTDPLVDEAQLAETLVLLEGEGLITA
jgi:hypothetical protein